MCFTTLHMKPGIHHSLSDSLLMPGLIVFMRHHLSSLHMDCHAVHGCSILPATSTYPAQPAMHNGIVFRSISIQAAPSPESFWGS